MTVRHIAQLQCLDNCASLNTAYLKRLLHRRAIFAINERTCSSGICHAFGTGSNACSEYAVQFSLGSCHFTAIGLQVVGLYLAKGQTMSMLIGDTKVFDFDRKAVRL